jgi:hypothetical protein
MPYTPFRFAPRLTPFAAAVLLACGSWAASAQAPAPANPPAAPSTPAGAQTAAAAAGASATPPAAARPAPLPGALPPFAEVVREAKRSDGYFPIWVRDDRVWLEIPAAMLGQTFFMTTSVATGMGDSQFFWPGLLGRTGMVMFKRVGNNVQLIARNMNTRAPQGTPLERAVLESYSDSLLASVPVVSAPEAQNKAILVDATLLMGGDFNNTQTQLETVHRLPYALDRGNTHIERQRTDKNGSYFTVRQHYAVPRLPAPPVLSPGAPPPNPAALPNPPRSLPDSRSLFLTYTYTLAPLPAVPMKTRLADARVGYFTTPFTNMADDNSDGMRTHYVRRWRLEKKDPAAAVSEPKEAIRVVMDRNIPEKWRPAVREGIVEWNKAFERAGFRNAIVVEQQADNADWTSLEGTRVLAVRWFAIDGPGATAVGPSHSDPRTGEMLRGASIIPENWVRLFRGRAIDLQPRLPDVPAQFAQAFNLPIGEVCTYAAESLEQAQTGFELLVQRGLDPNGPQGDAFIAGALKDVTMHEVGHALGLRHNFRASVGITPEQLRDPAFTRARGVSNSVMDYNAQNTPLEGERVADYHMPTLGTYDYWAIEFGYREFASAEEEKRELARLAQMGERDPNLAYATDEDLANNDPNITQRDLGNNPLAFAERQLKIARELWRNTAARPLPPDDDFTIYRRNLQRVFASMEASLPMAGRYLGGTFTTRARAGSGQALVTPVPAAQQRQALALILGEVFASNSFKFDPRIMARLGVDNFERQSPGRGSGVDFSVAGRAGSVQRAALDGLMSDGLASRLADAEAKVSDPRALLSYAEVQERLSAAVWSELGSRAEIDSLRRTLQREHLRRLAGALVRASSPAAPNSSAAGLNSGTPPAPADTRPVYRQTALALQAQLQRAVAAPGQSATQRAHLSDALATLSEALKAPLVKQGV